MKGLPLTYTLAAAIDNLPPCAAEPPGILQGHFCKPLKGIELERAFALKPGQTMRDLPKELQHESFQRRAFRRVMDGTPTERRGGAPSGVKRLKGDEPAKAITGGAIAEFLHPTEHRPLTIRECARIQTFPDEFTFWGSLSEQIQIIGNAVPPLLAQKIGENLIQELPLTKPSSTKGCLLSFIPTVADGVSPALKNVVERVTRMFMYTESLEQHTLWD